MCGFAGQFNLFDNSVDQDVIKSMIKIINHRGPDSRGLYVEKNFGVGHCRLAIQDLSVKGNQPMVSNDGRYIIAYNGEIYNFKVLRRILEKKNYFFNSKTDTEVVLNSFIEWKKDAVKKLNGMFAFIIWDKKLKKLFCARDRYGIKPLYYHHQNNSFIFSSEIKGIIQNPNVKKR